jgi:Asp-tRNA(Asn)/Glu-tRNA(Gln) amidotransferase A subunit family amidase
LLSAAAIAARIREGVLSAVDVVDDCLARIDALDGDLKAFVHVDRAGARLAARQRHEATKHGAVSGALFGVPVALKDIFDVGGWPTAAGAHPSFAYTAGEDSAAAARLRDAGAILLGKTATTEFAYADPAATRNPWDLSRTPGGSSSGSAAAVSAGLAPAALGSQTVGSVLRPAAYCGVVGLKPTHGRVSTRGVLPLAWSLDHVGVFGRSVADAGLLLSVLAGYDPADPYSLDAPAVAFGASPPPRPPAFALLRPFYAGRSSTTVAGHLGGVAGRLASAGARVQEVSIPYAPDEVVDLGMPVLRAEAAAFHAARFRERPDAFRPRLRALIEAGLSTPAVDYVEAQRRRQQLRRDLLAALGGADALLLPVAPSAAPSGLDSTGDPVFCAPASFSGFPSISLPSGLDEEGLPLAVQLVGRPLGEVALLSVAAWLERELAFAHLPPLLAKVPGGPA